MQNANGEGAMANTSLGGQLKELVSSVAGLALVLGLAGCVGGVSGGGGGGILYSGGAPDSPCDEAQSGQGCVFASGTVQRVACQGGKWTALGTCTASELCAEEGVGPAKVASCKPKQGLDAGAGSDASTAGDAPHRRKDC